jgi:hypothetical protein
MPRFPELDASLGETLDLPVPLRSGQVKEYKVLPLDAETWARFTAMWTAVADQDDDEEVDKKTEEDYFRKALGDVYDQLTADGVFWAQVRRCGLAAIAWHLHGEERAMAVWLGASPKAPSTSETSSLTETPAEDPSTPSPASETGTTPSPRRARASRGPTSSAAGSS